LQDALIIFSGGVETDANLKNLHCSMFFAWSLLPLFMTSFVLDAMKKKFIIKS
jgi:hypothetical protein